MMQILWRSKLKLDISKYLQVQVLPFLQAKKDKKNTRKKANILSNAFDKKKNLK